ncbi:conserved Plasmodium protein, unknown function [Plasmodium sp. DRC-Itaito]|nr:conserved Plasmodium protein, unknown function [Plasmodium sp. DRC-Itaito]
MEFRRYFSSEDYIFEIKNNEQLFSCENVAKNIKPLWSLKGHRNSIEGVHLIDNEKLCTVSHDNLVSIWRLEDKKNIVNIKFDDAILCSSYFKKNKYLCIGRTNMNNNINIINMDKEEIIESYISECNSIFSINYYDDNRISYGSKEGSICFFDLIKKKNIYRYEEIGDCINYCASSYTDNNLYNNNNINNNNDNILMNPNFHIFSTYKGNILFFDLRCMLPIYQNNNLHSNYSVNCLYCYNYFLYSGASDCLIKKYDIRYIDEKKPLHIYIGHTSPIRYLSFSKNFSYFTSSSDNGCIKLWSVNKTKQGKENKTYSSFNNNLTSPSSAFSFDLDSPVNDPLKVKMMNIQNNKMADSFLQINREKNNKIMKENKIISPNNNKKNNNININNINSNNIYKNMRSSSIVSDTNYCVNNSYDTTQKKKERKNIFSKKYENILSEFQKKKRTITPNTILTISNEKKKKVQAVSKNELFNMCKMNKTQLDKEKSHKGHLFLNDSLNINKMDNKLMNSKKNQSIKEMDILKNKKRNDQFKMTNKLHIPSPINYSNTKGDKIYKGKNERSQIKRNISKDTNKYLNIQSPISNKFNESYYESFFYNNENVINNLYPSSRKVKIKYAHLSMLNHKGRVTSMEWLDHLLFSVSWDQTIKCWNVKKYLME